MPRGRVSLTRTRDSTATWLRRVSRSSTARDVLAIGKPCQSLRAKSRSMHHRVKVSTFVANTAKADRTAPGLVAAARAGAALNAKRGTQAAKDSKIQYGKDLAETITQHSGMDALDAAVALATIDFEIGELSYALTHLPPLLPRPATPSLGGNEDIWSAVCVVQGTLVKGIDVCASLRTLAHCRRALPRGARPTTGSSRDISRGSAFLVGHFGISLPDSRASEMDRRAASAHMSIL